jgi:hypothetical protein
MNQPSQYNNRKPIHFEASDQEEEVMCSVETRQVGINQNDKDAGQEKDTPSTQAENVEKTTE